MPDRLTNSRNDILLRQDYELNLEQAPDQLTASLKKAHIRTDSASFTQLLSTLDRYGVDSKKTLSVLVESKKSAFAKLCSWLSFKLLLGKSARRDLQILRDLSRQLSIPRILDNVSPHIRRIGNQSVVCTPVMVGTAKMIRLESGAIDVQGKLVGSASVIPLDDLDKFCEGKMNGGGGTSLKSSFETQVIELNAGLTTNNIDARIVNRLLESHDDTDIAFLTSLLMSHSYRENSTSEQNSWSLAELLQMDLLLNTGSENLSGVGQGSLSVSQDLKAWIAENILSSEGSPTFCDSADDIIAFQEAVNAGYVNSDPLIELILDKSSSLKDINLAGLTLSTSVMMSAVKAIHEGRAPNDILHGADLSMVNFTKIDSLKNIHLDTTNILSVIEASNNIKERARGLIQLAIKEERAPADVMSRNYLCAIDFEGLKGLPPNAMRSSDIQRLIEMVEIVKAPSVITIDADLMNVDFTGLEGIEALNFAGANIRGSVHNSRTAKFFVEQVRQQRVSSDILAYTHCEGVDWSYQDLSQMNFTGTVLDNGIFVETRLSGTRFDNASLNNTRFNRAVPDEDCFQSLVKAYETGKMSSGAPLMEVDRANIRFADDLPISQKAMNDYYQRVSDDLKRLGNIINPEKRLENTHAKRLKELRERAQEIEGRIQSFEKKYGKELTRRRQHINTYLIDKESDAFSKAITIGENIQNISAQVLALSKEHREVIEQLSKEDHEVKEQLNTLPKLYQCYIEETQSPVMISIDYSDFDMEFETYRLSSSGASRVVPLSGLPAPEQAQYISGMIKEKAFSHKVLKDVDISSWNLSNFDLSETKFIGVIAATTEFAHSVLRETVFDNTDLSGANLSDTVLENISFNCCNLNNTNFTNALFDGNRCVMKDVSVTNPHFEKTTFTREVMAGILSGFIARDPEECLSLNNCVFSGLRFDGLDLRRLKLTGDETDLGAVSLINTQLSRQTIRSILELIGRNISANIPSFGAVEKSIFRGSNWHDVDIRGLDLMWDDKSDTNYFLDLSDVNFSKVRMDRNNVVALMATAKAGLANLSVFSQANLNEADMSYLDLRPFDFSETLFHDVSFTCAMLDAGNIEQLYSGTLAGRGDMWEIPKPQQSTEI